MLAHKTPQENIGENTEINKPSIEERRDAIKSIITGLKNHGEWFEEELQQEKEERLAS